MTTSGVITDFYQRLRESKNLERNKIMREYLAYILQRKPTPNDYKMMFKLIGDFGYELVFGALLDFSYSSVTSEGQFWGYIIGICKNRLNEKLASEEVDDYKSTNALVQSLISIRETINPANRLQLLEGMYD